MELYFGGKIGLFRECRLLICSLYTLRHTLFKTSNSEISDCSDYLFEAT